MNQIPVLDKGYVSLVSSSMSREKLMTIQGQYFRGKAEDRLLDIPHLHMEIKCPLFVQLAITQGLNCVTRSATNLEAYKPSVNDIKANDLQLSEDIAQDIHHTTEALLMNPKAYQTDGCDIFISQVISPISIYNTILVSGTLRQWIDFANREGLASPIDQFFSGSVLVARRKKQKQVNEIETKYTTKIKYQCPKRGWVEEEVTVTRFKAKEQDESKYGYSFMEEEKESEEQTEESE
jgi:hypothetical protein